MIVDRLLGPQGAIYYADFDVVSIVLVSIYGTFRVAYQKVNGVTLSGKFWRWMDVLVEFSRNLPGAVNKALVASGRAPLLPHPDVVAAEARADAAEAAASNARASLLVAPAPLRVPTLPGVTPPPAE